MRLKHMPENGRAGAKSKELLEWAQDGRDYARQHVLEEEKARSLVREVGSRARRVRRVREVLAGGVSESVDGVLTGGVSVWSVECADEV